MENSKVRAKTPGTPGTPYLTLPPLPGGLGRGGFIPLPVPSSPHVNSGFRGGVARLERIGGHPEVNRAKDAACCHGADGLRERSRGASLMESLFPCAPKMGMSPMGFWPHRSSTSSRPSSL